MPILKNAKHEAVLAAFIANSDRVGWRAYQSVYPNSSQRAAETAWSRLMKDAEFSARHDELVGAVTEEAKRAAVMDLTEVLEELSKLGRSNIQNVVVRSDDTADVVQSLSEMAPEHAAAIKSLTIETYMEGAGEEAREVKKLRFELHDKKGALSELRRHFEPDKHEHTGKDGKPIEVADATEPLDELDVARRIAFLLERAARAPARPAAAAKAGAKAKAKPKPKAKVKPKPKAKAR